MKRICTYCSVVSADLNRWCQEKHCPVENASEIADNGEWFGPIQITEPLVVMRSAIIYRAQREHVPVLLKVANEGCENKLHGEAQAFLQLAKIAQHPSLPVLLPAHTEGSLAEHPSGWIVVNGKAKHFMVFKDVQGETLRVWLLKNPQPWYKYAGWIVMAVGDVIYFLQQHRILHLCLNPDMLLLRFDSKGVPRPVLLDLGIGRDDQGEANARKLWNGSNNLPAYTPPELLHPNERVTPAADVYGLGLLLYEMLSGHPAFPYQMKKDQQVIREVLFNQAPDPNRPDLEHMNLPLPSVTMKAIARRAAARYPDVLTFVNQVGAVVGPIPPEPRRRLRWNWSVFFTALGFALGISLILLFALTIAQP